MWPLDGVLHILLSHSKQVKLFLICPPCSCVITALPLSAAKCQVISNDVRSIISLLTANQGLSENQAKHQLMFQPPSFTSSPAHQARKRKQNIYKWNQRVCFPSQQHNRMQTLILCFNGCSRRHLKRLAKLSLSASPAFTQHKSYQSHIPHSSISKYRETSPQRVFSELYVTAAAHATTTHEFTRGSRAHTRNSKTVGKSLKTAREEIGLTCFWVSLDSGSWLDGAKRRSKEL